MKYLALMIVALVMLATPLAARAQDATPVAISMAPSPEECTVDPITAERLTAALTPASATPEAEFEVLPEATPQASPTAFVMPEGTPADEATTTAISAAVRLYIACINAGDSLRILALYSDQGLRTILATPLEQGFTVDDILTSLGTAAQPLPEDQQTILYGIDSVTVLADGRVAALIVGDNQAEPGPPGPALMYFVQVDGTWLVDGFVPTSEITSSEPAS